MKIFDPGNVFKLRDILPTFFKQMFNVRFELTFESMSDVLNKTINVYSRMRSSMLLVAPEKKLFTKLFIVFLNGIILTSSFKCVISLFLKHPLVNFRAMFCFICKHCQLI